MPSPLLHLALTAVAVTGLAFGKPSDSIAGCSSVRHGAPLVGHAIGLVGDGPGVSALIEEALAVWQRCPNYASDFPQFVPLGSVSEVRAISPAPTSVVHVQVVGGSSGNQHCGFFRGRKIVLYASALLQSGEARGCGSMALNLAHELGHALGLLDGAGGNGCGGTIMAELSLRNLHRREVSAEECRLAGERWLTFFEWQDPDAASAMVDLELAAGGVEP